MRERTPKSEAAIERGHKIRNIRSKRRQLRDKDKRTGEDHSSDIEHMDRQIRELGGRA